MGTAERTVEWLTSEVERLRQDAAEAEAASKYYEEMAVRLRAELASQPLPKPTERSV